MGKVAKYGTPEIIGILSSLWKKNYLTGEERKILSKRWMDILAEGKEEDAEAFLEEMKEKCKECKEAPFLVGWVEKIQEMRGADCQS